MLIKTISYTIKRVFIFWSLSIFCFQAKASIVCKLPASTSLGPEEYYLYDYGREVYLGRKLKGIPTNMIGKFSLMNAVQDPAELDEKEMKFLQKIFPGREWFEMDLMAWTFRTLRGGQLGKQHELLIADLQAYSNQTNNSWERYILINDKDFIKCR